MTADVRYHSLDAARAGALLAGIVLHAALSFVPGFREVHWPISDDSSGAAMGALFFVIHIFRMSLFFLIAGFFARLLFERLGTWGFAKNRLRRIALPLLAAMVCVMPLVFVAFVIGMRQLGLHGPPSAEPPIPQRGIPWGHLWFLYLLLVLYVLVVGGRAAVAAADRSGALRAGVDRVLRALFETRLAAVALAAPLAATLFLTPWWQQWGGIPTPIMGFVPNFPAVLAYGSAVALGWLLHRNRALLDLLARDWAVYLVIAAIAATVALYVVGPAAQLRVMPMAEGTRGIYAASYSLALWCGCFAGLGAAVRFLSAPSARWRYLADASFWMYLVHVPIVFLLQVAMMKWPLHWSLKFALVLAITAPLLLGSYHALVRFTFVGKFLNGHRHARGAPLTSAPSTSPG